MSRSDRAILDRAAAWCLLVPVRAYRFVLSPFFPGSCRYEPSCSAYAVEAVRTHGPWRGAYLMLRRLARCHPLGGWGYDPVPPAAYRRTGPCAAGCGHEAGMKP